jgi:hypothetical protein
MHVPGEATVHFEDGDVIVANLVRRDGQFLPEQVDKRLIVAPVRLGADRQLRECIVLRWSCHSQQAWHDWIPVGMIRIAIELCALNAGYKAGVAESVIQGT